MSQENDEIFLPFDQATNLAHSIVNTSVDSDQISDKLDINFEVVESPAMQIQLGEEPEMSEELIQVSTPLTEKILRYFMIKKK